MSYVVLVRGPLGVGKTSVSRTLADAIGAKYISIDQILDDEGLWERGRLAEFLAANDRVSQKARRWLERGRPVVVDGNFYWKTQIDDLARRLARNPYVFTLKAPLRTCIARDARRRPPHGSEAARAVFAKATRFDWGIGIDATRAIPEVVRDIASHLPWDPTARIRRQARRPRPVAAGTRK